MKAGKTILTWALALTMLFAWSGLAAAAADKDAKKDGTTVEDAAKDKKEKKDVKKKAVKKDTKKAVKKTDKKKAAKKDTKKKATKKKAVKKDTKKKATKKAAKKTDKKKAVKKDTKKKATKKATKKTDKKKAVKKDTKKKAAKKDTKWTPPKKAININKASAKDLQAFYGIGDVRAKAIVDYRKKHGAFKKPEDLKKVQGVGDEIFKKNQKYISVK